MNELNAVGILPLESNSSFTSIRQTDTAYQTVRIVATNVHEIGSPELVQTTGTKPNSNSKPQ